MLNRRSFIGWGAAAASLCAIPAHAWFPHGTAGASPPPPAGLSLVTPGTTAYRSWAIDNTAYTSSGTPSDFGYGEVPSAQWVNGMYDRFTGTYLVGVAAWKGPRVVDAKAGNLRGIQKVEFSCNNGPWLEVDTPFVDTLVGGSLGIEAYWCGLRSSDFANSQTVEIRAKVTPIIGVPVIMQGRSAAGPGGQSATLYDTSSGPQIWNWDGTGDGHIRTFVNTPVDPRIFSAGLEHGPTASNRALAYFPAPWSLVVNVDTSDGILPTHNVYLDPDDGSDSNNGLSAAAPVKTMDRAVAVVASSCGVTRSGPGVPNWTDYGGTNINLMASLNHCLWLTADPTPTFFSAADQWVTIQPAPGVDPSTIWINTGGAPGANQAHGFFPEKLRFYNLKNIFQCALMLDAGGAASKDVRYGDVRVENCRFIGTGMTVTSGSPFSVKVNSGGTGYVSPTVTCAGASGTTFTPVVSGGVITSITASGGTVPNGAALAITDSGGSGASANVYVMYGGQSNSPAAFNTGGACKGHVEIIGDPADYAGAGLDGMGNPVGSYTYLDMGGTGCSNIATLVRHVSVCNMSSVGDIFPAAKCVLGGLRIRNSKEWLDPKTGTYPGSQNHFDVLQCYYPQYNAIWEDLDVDASCALQAMFNDSFAPIINCAAIRPNLNPAGFNGAGQQAGAFNTYFLKPNITSWKSAIPVNRLDQQTVFTVNNAQITALEANVANNSRIVITDEINQQLGSDDDVKDELNRGWSVVYTAATPSEPNDKPVSNALANLLNTGSLIDLWDATDTGSMRIRKNGSSGRTDPRVALWWDPTAHPQGGWNHASYAQGSQIINAVTNASPGVLTVQGHKFRAGVRVSIGNNTVTMPGLAGLWFANVIDANTFTLLGQNGVPLDTTSSGAYGYTTTADGSPALFSEINEAPLVGRLLESTDQRRPEFMATGLNGLPCVAFNVGNPTNNDSSVTDHVMPFSVQPVFGSMQHEVWYCGSNEHPNTDTSTTARYFFSYGSTNGVSMYRKWNAANGGFQEIHATVGMSYNSGASVTTTDVVTDFATFGSVKGAFIARIQAMSDRIRFTVWNAATIGANQNGVTKEQLFSAVQANTPALSIANLRGGLGGDCRGIVTGAQGTFVQNKVSAFMVTNPLSAGEAAALVSEFRSRLGL